MAKASRKRANEKTLRPVHPNAGIEAAYRRRMLRLVEEMNDSFVFWLKAAYRQNPPRMAMDRTPAQELRAALKKLAARWQRNFDEAAPKLADWFSRTARSRSDGALRSILRNGGFTVRFTLTPPMRDVLDATINQNVTLIRSIPAQYLTQVEGAVMRSVTAGRDLESLAKELQDHYGVTKRRAAFIARSQNNLATASMTRVRQVQLGITEAIWVHSGGGKHPRPSHMKASRDKTRYDTSKGWLDPEVGKYIFPGELPNCRCVSKPLVPGFE
jgi:SPP1 gp7 family putative phage head morphogenesis protein